MFYILTYSYLLFPIILFFFRVRIKDRFLILLYIYGIAFFSLIFFDDVIPIEIKKYYQGFYTLLEYSIFTYVYWLNNKNKIFRRFVLFISALFLLFELYYVSNTTLQKLDSIPIGIETILVFIYIFLFFFDYAKRIKDTFIYYNYCFWISVGILIYLGGSFFFYILVNHLDQKDIERFINLTYISELIKNIFFIISIFIYKKFSYKSTHNFAKEIPKLDMI